MRRVRAMVMLSLSSLWLYEESWLKLSARSLLWLLGFIFLGTAAALAFGGVLAIMMYENYKYLLQESFLSLPGWLAVVAALILLPAGILAISISAKSSRYQQGVLMYLLLVLLCLEMSLAVLVQFYTVRMASELKRTQGYLYPYNGTHSQGPGSRTEDIVQRNMQCCGAQNYTDWLKAIDASWHFSAESCCKKYSDCRSDLGDLEQLFQEVCLKKLKDWLHFVMTYLFWFCTVLSILELLAGATNGILMRYQPLHDLRFLDSSTFS